MDTQERRQMRMKFLHSEEGRVFVVGCFMLIIWVESIAVLWHLEHPTWSYLAKMGLAHVPAGRATSVAYAIQAGLSPMLAAFLAIYLDVMALFIIYPILVFSYKNLVERRFFKEHFQSMFDEARKHMTRFRRFKITGVFLFVWFPFWMTGVIGGSILGFLLGLKTKVNLATVILGTSSAVICWAYFYDNLFAWLGKIHKGIPLAIVLAAICIAACFRILRQKKGVPR